MQKLLTKSILSKLPPLESTDDLPPEAIIIPCCFFLPGTSWSWYPFEFDGQDTFFGLVQGLYVELGYFTLEELTRRKGSFGLSVERDKFFIPCSLTELRKRIKKNVFKPLNDDGCIYTLISIRRLKDT